MVGQSLSFTLMHGKISSRLPLMETQYILVLGRPLPFMLNGVHEEKSSLSIVMERKCIMAMHLLLSFMLT